MFRKTFNKLKDRISVGGKYNKLFGTNNWKMTDYHYSRDQNWRESNYGYDVYDISKSYKIKIINQHNTPNSHLSNDEIRKLSSKLRLYEWQLLYKYNRILFDEMEMHINVTFLKFEIKAKILHDEKHYPPGFGFNSYDPFDLYGDPIGFLPRTESRSKSVDNMSDYRFINLFIKSIDL